MSVLNLGLTFYIIQLDEDSFNLYNATTDKDILFAVEKNCVKDFLELNEPSHPFLLKDKKIEPSLDFFYEYDLGETTSNIGNGISFDYSMHDPFYSTTHDGIQMSFSFMEDIDKAKGKEEDTDNVLPFLPDEDK